MMSAPLITLFLLLLTCVIFVAPVVGSGSVSSNDESCSFELNMNSSPIADIKIQQHISNNKDVTISLSVEGKAWVAVGFNRDGQMVGSTVVIGLPGQPREPDINPGRYYLGAKDMKQINRVDGSGTRVGVEWKKSQVATEDTDNDGGNGEEEEEEEWRRSLYLPQEHHRLLAISNASFVQNLTHTTLSFTRPLASSDKYMTAVTENDLNTLIWAVGSSNDFGYHGSQRGSHTLNFTSCPHGLLDPPTSSYDAFEGGVEARNETDEDTMERENEKIDLTTASLTNAASTFTSYIFGLLFGISASCLIMT